VLKEVAAVMLQVVEKVKEEGPKKSECSAELCSAKHACHSCDS
jgi:hypothetical protein